MCRSASMVAVSSIRLLVVWPAPPPSSVTWPAGVTTIAPHPPGPGFPFAAPSAKTTIGISGMGSRYGCGAPEGRAQARSGACLVSVGQADRDLDPPLELALAPCPTG